MNETTAPLWAAPEITGRPMSGPMRRSLFMLEAAASALDKNGNPTADIVMFRADYQRVRKHLGVKARGEVKFREHKVLNGGVAFQRNLDRKPSL